MDIDSIKELSEEASEISDRRSAEVAALITRLVDEAEKRIHEAFVASGLPGDKFNMWLNRQWLSDIVGRDAWYHMDWTAGTLSGSRYFASALGKRLSKDIRGASEMHADLWIRPEDPGYVIRSEAREIRFWFYQYVSPD